MSPFGEAVRQAAEGTPYAVSETAKGFDLHLDLADAQWFGILNAAGLDTGYTNHVHERSDGIYTIVDDFQRIEWVAGAPRTAASAERMRGRQIRFGAEKIWALGTDGRVGPVVDYRFDSEEGRQLISLVGERLGLESKRGIEERVGLTFALIGGVGALVAVVVLVVLAVLGKLS